MRIAESELIINGDGSVFHLHLRPEELADNVILVGDPGRVDMIAEYFDEREFRHESREFVSVTGKYKVEAWNSACLSRCPRGERPLVELYLEPGVFFRTMHRRVTAPSC